MKKLKPTFKGVREALEEDELYGTVSETVVVPDGADNPVKDSTHDRVQIKEVALYPKELVIYFNDGSVRTYVEKT